MKNYYSIISIAICVIILLLLAIITIKTINFLFYKMHRFARESFKLSDLFIILGFSICLVFSSSTLMTAFKSGTILLSTMLEDMRGLFSQETIKATSSNSANLSSQINIFMSSVLIALKVFVLSFPLFNILVYILSSFLLGYILQQFTLYISELKEMPSDNKKYIKNMALLKNFSVVATLVLAFYLSIAAIIAVPRFQDKLEIDQSAVTQFNILLSQYTISDESFNHRFKDSILLSTDTSYRPSLKTRVNSGWTFMRSRTHFQIRQNTQLALTRFESANASRLPSTEKHRFRSKLLDWYVSTTNALINNLDQAQYKYFTLFPQGNTRNRADSLTSRENLVRLNETFHSQFNNTSQILAIPVPKDAFGSFDLFAGWLLQTEYLPLAVITGLLGFGLLGAAGSTYIREQQDDSKSNNIVIHNLGGVVIRGLSAAIVVFLAVKGGQAVFSNTNDDLNPYALFFTCLIASVFSDDVWLWAHSRAGTFGRNVPENRNSTKEDQNMK